MRISFIYLYFSIFYEMSQEIVHKFNIYHIVESQDWKYVLDSVIVYERYAMKGMSTNEKSPCNRWGCIHAHTHGCFA